MEKETSIAGKNIFYRVYGKGKTVMLVHGFGETGEIWETQIQHLKDNYHLIIPDLPGSGRSEIIDDMSMEGMAEILKIIIDTELKNTGESLGCTMIGHSMGGYITLAYAEKYGGSLQSFGLFHSSSFADTEEKRATRRKGIEYIREHGAYDFLKTAIPNLFSPGSKESKTGIIDDLIEKAHNFSPEALVLYYESMIKRPDRTEILKTTRVPVLFVMGKYDTAVPIEDGLKQCHLPEKSYIHVLHESGHLGMLEEPENSNRLLEEFLST